MRRGLFGIPSGCQDQPRWAINYRRSHLFPPQPAPLHHHSQLFSHATDHSRGSRAHTHTHTHTHTHAPALLPTIKEPAQGPTPQESHLKINPPLKGFPIKWAWGHTSWRQKLWDLPNMTPPSLMWNARLLHVFFSPMNVCVFWEEKILASVYVFFTNKCVSVIICVGEISQLLSLWIWSQ